LAKLPSLVDATIEDHDVKVTAQQSIGWRRSKAEQDAPNGRHDIAFSPAHGCRLCFDQGIPCRRCRAGHGDKRVCRQRSGQCRCPGKQLTTVHVLMRPDGHDRGNPRVRPGCEEGNRCLVAEQLEAMSTCGAAQQLSVEVVRLLMVVDPSADERNQALGLGEDDRIDRSLTAQLGDQSAVGSVEFLQHNGQAVDAGCCHGVLLPQAPSGTV
jgi:hypothetical protein